LWNTKGAEPSPLKKYGAVDDVGVLRDPPGLEGRETCPLDEIQQRLLVSGRGRATADDRVARQAKRVDPLEAKRRPGAGQVAVFDHHVAGGVADVEEVGAADAIRHR
jgi:hypothetical protein